MAATVADLSGGSSEEIIAADEYRDYITIQMWSARTVYLAFGEDAADATGIALFRLGDSIRVRGPKARVAINGYTDGAAKLGIETYEDVEYRPGPIA